MQTFQNFLSSNEWKVTSNKQKVTSNKQKLTSNEQRVKIFTSGYLKSQSLGC